MCCYVIIRCYFVAIESTAQQKSGKLAIEFTALYKNIFD